MADNTMTNSTQDSAMEILCASDERYLPHAAAMLCSLLEHNTIFRIHFFHGPIDSSELMKLRLLVSRYGCEEIVFYEIRQADFEDLRVDKWASVAVYYRLLAPRLLPASVEKVLYLDSDIIVRQSLASLWSTDISNRPLAAVPNYYDDARIALGLPEGTKYFNSGVLLINVKFWREYNVAEEAISFIKNNPEKVQYWDQDALNANLVGQWVELPSQWNWQGWDWQDINTPNPGAGPAIVHFIAGDKPWHWSNNHPYKDEYHRYRLKTPWRQYRQEGRPGAIRIIARAVLPAGVRKWMRSRLSHTGKSPKG